MVRAEIDLPGSVLDLIRVDKDQLGPYIKRSLAVELFREGKLSLGKAAELAGAKNKWEMLTLLSERGVPLDYTAKDAEKDLQTLNEVLGKMIAVSNSTPLIALSKIGQLDLLKEYFGDIYIPEEVYDEVVRRGGNLAGAPEVASSAWIKVEQVKNVMAVQALCISLDRGEAEAIVLSKEKNALLIIDDGDGRRTAEHMGLKITGTIGILLLASQKGDLDFERAMDDLKAVGFRIGDREYERILSLVGQGDR